MLGGQHQGKLVVGVGQHLEQIVEIGWKLTADDRQIDLTVGHAPAGAAGAVHLQLHRHIRILLAEQTDHARHQVGAGGLAGAHDQGATPQVVEIVKGAAGLLALAEDAVAVAEQQVAGLGELGLAAAPIEQRNVQLLLQILDLQAHRRLGHIEAVGRLLEAALTGDGPQNAQLIEGEGQIGHGGTRGPAPSSKGKSRRVPTNSCGWLHIRLRLDHRAPPEEERAPAPGSTREPGSMAATAPSFPSPHAHGHAHGIPRPSPQQPGDAGPAAGLRGAAQRRSFTAGLGSPTDR